MDEFSLIGLGFLSAGAQAHAHAQRRTRDAQRRRISHSRVASHRCARLRVIRRGGAGITTQSLPATFGSFHVTDVLALAPQPMRMRRGRPAAQALKAFRTAPC
jgi:hypothetical protein